MKRYKGHKPLDEIKAAVEKNKWFWDQEKFDDGSDYVTFGFNHGKKKLTVVYNTFNGTFIIKDGKSYITERDTKFDNVRWYVALLDFIYVPAELKKAAA